jgi:5'-phosphate synthase pdxT subunit
LATLPDEMQVVVAVRQGAIMATAFHPELTRDTRWHALFLDMVRQASREKQQNVSSTES